MSSASCLSHLNTSRMRRYGECLLHHVYLTLTQAVCADMENVFCIMRRSHNLCLSHLTHAVCADSENVFCIMRRSYREECRRIPYVYLTFTQAVCADMENVFCIMRRSHKLTVPSSPPEARHEVPGARARPHTSREELPVSLFTRLL